MQNNYGQPQQAPQQPQYQQYPGYPYPPQPKEKGGVFALLGFIFSLSGIVLAFVAQIILGAASSFGALTAYGIILLLALLIGATGTVFSAIALKNNKGKKLFAQIGFIAGLVCVTIGLSNLGQIILAFRGIN